MDISNLYEELGRATSAQASLAGVCQRQLAQQHQEELDALHKKQQHERESFKAKCRTANARVDELKEAVRLAEEGMDPLLAKLKAKESLEDRIASGEHVGEDQLPYIAASQICAGSISTSKIAANTISVAKLYDTNNWAGTYIQASKGSK